MRKISVSFFLFLNLILLSDVVIAQAGWWTWISGSSMLGAPSVFGTQGIPSVLNHPAGSYEQLQWKDKQGNFWLYGGTYPALNDLWKYDPVTNEWTWVHGTGTAHVNAVYGTMGVPSPANDPGERSYGAGAWADTSGNLWLFGGSNNSMNSFSDLWKYDIAANVWTWMNGPNTGDAAGVHGTQGVPAASNVPGARTEAYANWTDENNNLYIFGGIGYDDAGALGDLNDPCKYDISTNQWTWMKGSAFIGSPITYGTMGVSSAANDPGARYVCSNWKDLQNNLWFFGGNAGGHRNDTWKYDPLINEWTWMAGPNILDDSGVYQSQCIFNSTNVPSSRYENRATVADNCGNFWMFGGLALGVMNDLWVFDPQLLQWNWVSGSSTSGQPGSWGTMGMASATNIPSSRCSGIAWWGNDNKFYLFGGPDGGITTGFADLWVYNPDTACLPVNCSVPLSAFTAPNNICPGTCTNFTNLSVNATSYLWTFNGASTVTSTDVNPQTICYNFPGSYDVSLIAFNSTGSDTLLLANFINVYPYPAPQGIQQSGDTLFANAGAISYQWYMNGNIIPGATGYFYVATTSSNYNIVATDVNGCEVEAAIFDVFAEVQTLSSGSGAQLEIYPNPVSNTLSVNRYLLNGAAMEISIYNMLGENVFSIPETTTRTFDCKFLTSGIYILEVTASEKIYRMKFIKE
jgi:hypothetical protein